MTEKLRWLILLLLCLLCGCSSARREFTEEEVHTVMIYFISEEFADAEVIPKGSVAQVSEWSPWKYRGRENQRDSEFGIIKYLLAFDVHVPMGDGQSTRTRGLCEIRYSSANGLWLLNRLDFSDWFPDGGGAYQIRNPGRVISHDDLNASLRN